jgi:hypothetical protein
VRFLRKDAEGLAQGCAYLLLDDVLARRVGSLAREHVRMLYNRDAVVRRVSAVLTDTAP